MIPQIESCLVCDFVRPELYGKLTILGFFGVCPNVNVSVQRLDQPTALTFVFAGGPGDGSYMFAFDVVDESEQRVVASTMGLPFQPTPNAPTLLAPTLILVFGHPGRFLVRCMVDQAERFRAYFHISQAFAPLS